MVVVAVIVAVAFAGGEGRCGLSYATRFATLGVQRGVSSSNVPGARHIQKKYPGERLGRNPLCMHGGKREQSKEYILLTF